MAYDSKIVVLAVDDEVDNLHIIQDFLELDSEHDYELIMAEDADQGWKMLEQHGDDITTILLDRMMPGIDGLSMLKQIRKDERFSQIPVIMQTAAAAKEQISEGMQAGAYYYLTKPYEQDMLLAIVGAAVTDRRRKDKLKTELRQQKRLMKLFTSAEIAFQTLEQAQDLATFIAACFPSPDQVVMGLSELMINAIEHGNLEIGYQAKSQLIKENKWRQEISQRLKTAPYKDRWATLQFRRNADAIHVTIKDQGPGFDPSRYITIDPDRATHSHGRGIALANMMSFDKLEYTNGGNIVHCRVDINPHEAYEAA